MSAAIVARCDGQPGEFFTWAELTRNGQGMINAPDARAKNNLIELVQLYLDPLRRFLKRPIRVTSGYRNRDLNTAVGGSSNSSHLTGEAVDIKVEGMTAAELLLAIIAAGILDFDQLIAYAPERGGHLHFGIKAGAASRARRQKLWAPKKGGYEPFEVKT